MLQLNLEELCDEQTAKVKEENRRKTRVFQGFPTQNFAVWASRKFRSQSEHQYYIKSLFSSLQSPSFPAGFAKNS